jgi:predicted DNA repair protein MutK
MTTIASMPTSDTLEIKTPMLPFLQGLHQRWIEEVRRVLDPARANDAGLWMRWRAIQYLKASFTRRFVREQRAVMNLHSQLTGTQATHLWAAGELLTQLLANLSPEIGLCHRQTEFATTSLTILDALEYWCQQVEEALGGVRWGKVSPESRHLFEVITWDEEVEGYQ